MEKHNMSAIFRAGILLVVFVLSGIAARAQVITNGGFELPSGANYINGTVTNPAALGWTQFGVGFRTGTNCPSDASDTCSPITAHTGGYAMRAFSQGSWNLGSGAYQHITNGVSAGQQWALNGYALNWSGDPFSNQTVTAKQFGFIQIQFQNGSSQNVGGGFDSPNIYPTNTPLDTWISTSVTGMAPVGTSQILVQLLVVGFGATSGSLFFDDLSLVNLNAPIVTNFLQEAITGGNQICWPTMTNASYLVQSSPDNSTWSNVVNLVVAGTTNVVSLIAGDGNTNCTFDAAGEFNNHKFYRVLELK